MYNESRNYGPPVSTSPPPARRSACSDPARGMFSIIIFLLSAVTTQATNGLQKTGEELLTEPAYQKEIRENRGEKNNYVYNPYNNERIDDYSSWGNNEIEKEDSLNEEEVRFAGYPDGDVQKGSRRLFEWFSRLFQSTTPRAAQPTATTTESSYRRELKERIFLRALHRNLTDVLFKLSDVQKRVSFAMEEKKAYAILTKGKPEILGLSDGFYYRDRLKRDVSKVIKSETITETVAAEKSANDTDRPPADVNVNATETMCGDITSGRRAGSVLTTPTEVKNKLLLYLQESFQEIKSKIASLRSLKQAFSDNISFKIGYILANVDTLEISMLNLKNNLDKSKELWEDNKILELYDTLRVSNQAVSGLIESLKAYLDKLSYQPQVKTESFG